MQAIRSPQWFDPAPRADFQCTQCNAVHVGTDRPRLDHNGRCEGCRGYCNGSDCECPVACECTHAETCGVCPLVGEVVDLPRVRFVVWAPALVEVVL